MRHVISTTAAIVFVTLMIGSHARSATCPKAAELESKFTIVTKEVFQQKDSFQRLSILDKKIASIRASYKNSKCVMYQSYLAVLLGMRNMFVSEEKEQAKNFKEYKALFSRSISKTKRANDAVNYLISLKNQVRTYSYLPEGMTKERGEAIKNLATAESLLDTLKAEKENTQLLIQIRESLALSKQRLGR
ncbi:hypothetical protein [Pseudobacteriovorax antillogorgiicola]|uniref:Uncharacterized protein n=1 Tax=Pseudobacteriovorax antillogorgiicola TaxID=1513793 RepID=A0A1Y6C558_9BACT|nr:hypothetical protein [Pseudobacteriovorax antillogorgiicola]TCS51188.1 hypothetical protein EDD56_11172 [Pseudobacteriovorax antillogorgiicola]SMF37621.1 hypothetical protein SAMN06296036_111106 [Pseudobacteriovorax antillogorgiicola]